MIRDACASRATGAVVTTSRIRRPGCPSAPAVRVRAHAPPVSDGPARTRHPAAFRSQHDIVDRVQRLLRHEACGIMLIPAALASALYVRPIGQSDPRVPATVGAGNSVQDVQQGELADGVLVDHAVRGPGRHALMHSSVGMHTAIPLSMARGSTAGASSRRRHRFLAGCVGSTATARDRCCRRRNRGLGCHRS